MSILSVPGADLHYDCVGAGPLIVFIPGAQGSGMIFQPIAHALKDRFTVLTYDRRGFSRSTLKGERDYAIRLETDADDVARLVEHVGQAPAIVLGSSSGAIVALTMLARRPDVVATLIAHEPPAARYVPEGDALIAENCAIYDVYRAEGIAAGMQRFVATWMPAPTSDRQIFQQVASPAMAAQAHANLSYWFEHELRQYPATRFDVDALRREADRLVFVMGEEMRGNPTTPIIEALSAEIGAPLLEFPGAHLGYAVKAPAFADALTRMLDERQPVNA